MKLAAPPPSMSTTRAPPVEMSTRSATRCKEGAVSSAQLQCVSTSARKTVDPKPIDAIRIRALRYPTSPTTPHEKVRDGLRGTHHTNEVPRRAPWDPSH
jgi:hypothetical protein